MKGTRDKDGSAQWIVKERPHSANGLRDTHLRVPLNQCSLQGSGTQSQSGRVRRSLCTEKHCEMKKAPFQPSSLGEPHNFKRKNRPSPQWTPAVDQSTSRDIATGCVAARRTRVGRALAQAVGLTLVHAKGLAPPSEYAARGLIVIIVNFVCVTRGLLSVVTDEKSTFAFTISAGWASQFARTLPLIMNILPYRSNGNRAKNRAFARIAGIQFATWLHVAIRVPFRRTLIAYRMIHQPVGGNL